MKAEKDALEAKRRERAEKLKADAYALRENNRQIKAKQQKSSLEGGRDQRAKEAEWQEQVRHSLMILGMAVPPRACLGAILSLLRRGSRSLLRTYAFLSTPPAPAYHCSAVPLLLMLAACLTLYTGSARGMPSRRRPTLTLTLTLTFNPHSHPSKPSPCCRR